MNRQSNHESLAVETACDFARSYIRWKSDWTVHKMQTVSELPRTTLNNVRIPLECIATIKRNGREEQFVLGASCKTERVFVPRDIWMTPNADRCAIAGSSEFLVVKRWDRVDKGVMLHPPSLGVQPERQCVDPNVAFHKYGLSLRHRPARRLESLEEIFAVLLGHREVVCRTTHAIDGGEITIEYPVKTLNFSERHRYYQVDTGPVLFFGEATGPKLIEHLHLAYIAHLGGEWAEFLVSAPTPIAGTAVSVHHFGDARHVAAHNSLWVVGEE